MRTRLLVLTCMALLLSSLCVWAEDASAETGSADDRGGTGGSANSTKQAIPNWEERPDVRRGATPLQKQTDSVFWGSHGSNSGTAASEFTWREDPSHTGYPMGWNTNSKSAILMSGANGKLFLELRESSEPTHLTRLVEVDGGVPRQLRLSYTTSSDVTLRVMQFGEQNRLVASVIEHELLQGEDQSMSVRLPMDDRVSRFLLVIEKGSSGAFELYEVSLDKEAEDEY